MGMLGPLTDARTLGKLAERAVTALERIADALEAPGPEEHVCPPPFGHTRAILDEVPGHDDCTICTGT